MQAGGGTGRGRGGSGTLPSWHCAARPQLSHASPSFPPQAATPWQGRLLFALAVGRGGARWGGAEVTWWLRMPPAGQRAWAGEGANVGVAARAATQARRGAVMVLLPPPLMTTLAEAVVTFALSRGGRLPQRLGAPHARTPANERQVHVEGHAHPQPVLQVAIDSTRRTNDTAAARVSGGGGARHTAPRPSEKRRAASVKHDIPAVSVAAAPLPLLTLTTAGGTGATYSPRPHAPARRAAPPMLTPRGWRPSLSEALIV